MTSYDDVARRWRDRELGRTTRDNLSHRRMPARDGEIQSYGSHFPLAVTLRNRKGEVRGFLLNGDRFSNTTTKHQGVVRDALSGYDTVTIPFSALNEAGIVPSSVEVIHQTASRLDRWTERHEDFPTSAAWEYETVTVPGTGGYLIDGTFYKNSEVHYWIEPDPLTPEHRERFRNRAQRYDWHPEGARPADPLVVEVRSVSKRSGHKVLRQKRGYGTWDLVWDEENQRVVYEIERTRHWLGESLIRADVRYRTGSWEWKTRRAYFISGFDHNEARESYFFSEVPKGVHPTTIDEAYEALKPGAVKLAESMGVEVQRQGDIFAIPMPGLTLKELKAMGGKHEKRKVEEVVRWGGNERRIIGGGILGTNHTASEVVRVGRLTYVRGTMRHEPNGRRPDHARIRIADGKTWCLAVQNLVPQARAPRRRQTAAA